MTKCLKKLSQFTVLNWIMLWFFLMNGGILLLPAEKFCPAVELWLSSHSVYWWAGLIISVSYFLSQAVIVLFNLAVDFLSRHVSSVKMTDMIKCLDFTERAVLREFVIQRRSVINLPVTEPSVRNLMNAGILTYAYGTPSQADESVIKGMMISLEARPYITYRVLGLSRSHMSEEDVAQIMSERPSFAARQIDRRI